MLPFGFDGPWIHLFGVVFGVLDQPRVNQARHLRHRHSTSFAIQARRPWSVHMYRKQRDIVVLDPKRRGRAVGLSFWTDGTWQASATTPYYLTSATLCCSSVAPDACAYVPRNQGWAVQLILLVKCAAATDR